MSVVTQVAHDVLAAALVQPNPSKRLKAIVNLMLVARLDRFRDRELEARMKSVHPVDESPVGPPSAGSGPGVNAPNPDGNDG